MLNVSDNRNQNPILTKSGQDKINLFLRECAVQRKEILDASKDTAGSTELPGVEDIVSDIAWSADLVEHEYVNCWGVTDNYDSDPLWLKEGEDYVFCE